MEKKTSKFILDNKNKLGAVALGALAIVGVAAFSLTAHAANVSVTSSILSSTTNLATTSVGVGGSVFDTVTIASSTSSTTPTGTVNFNLFPNVSCSAASTTQSGVALVNGMATSSASVVPSTGLSYLVNYGGDTTNASTTSSCVAVTATSVSTTSPSGPNAPEVITNAATNVTLSDATLNGTNGNNAATQESFWVSTSTINTSSSNIPTGVYSTPVLPAASANAALSDQLSLVTTQGITTGNVNANMPAITPNTTYYYVAWALVDGTWYPGAVQSLVTTPSTATGTATISGKVYNDANRNGALDGGETGLAGWTINLYNNAGWSGPTNIQPFMTVVSDASGNYSFANLPNGTYSLEEINQPASGWSQFTGDISPLVITNGFSITSQNFGDVQGNPSSGGGNGNGNNGNGNNGNGNGNGGNKGNGGNNGNQGNQGGQGNQHGNGFSGFIHDLGHLGGNHH